MKKLLTKAALGDILIHNTLKSCDEDGHGADLKESAEGENAH
ncbi:MAG: hypothetical protein ACI4HJ_07685 [Ruminococcus sp.]